MVVAVVIGHDSFVHHILLCVVFVALVSVRECERRLAVSADDILDWYDDLDEAGMSVSGTSIGLRTDSGSMSGVFKSKTIVSESEARNWE